MKGDFTRFTHDPKKHYSKVLKQQGRVDLDADWNESEDIKEYIRETTSWDVIGKCGVPKRDDKSFSLDWDGNILSILPGRIYVDGILCKMEESVQCYEAGHPVMPDAIRRGGHGGSRKDLVYLDVWQRHITAIEDPDIKEVALGGADTTTRLKTVVQVKVLEGVQISNCEDEIEDRWPPVPPLAERGRLSTKAEHGIDDEPCIIAPGGGYRGLENRLYRVEIHEGGVVSSNNDAGERRNPTFKWSRDNGSIALGIEDIVEDGASLSKVLVKSTGKDQVLSLRKGDWVEVLGDETELSLKPGTMAQIKGDPKIEQVISGKERMFAITLSENVSGHKDEGHRKVRRWDHKAKSAGDLDDGAIPVRSGQWIGLEDGVQISFEPGTYCTGDFWVFTARTATGDVEVLDQAPPKGIEHHHCKLAIVTWHWDSSGNINLKEQIDCRNIFPPLTELPKGGANCCTVTVGDGTTSVGDFRDIQEAVDSLAETGGRVCILPGTYSLKSQVNIRRDNLIISGCGRQMQIIANGFSALVAEGDNLRLESLKIEASSTKVAVLVRNSENLEIVECDLENEDNYALGVVASKGVTIKENMLNSPSGLVLQAERGYILGNCLSGGGVWIWEGSKEIRIENNRISGGPEQSRGNGTSGGVGPGIILGGLPLIESETKRDVLLDSLAPKKSKEKYICVSAVEILGNQINWMENSGISTHKDTSILEDVTIAHNRIIGCARRGPDSKFEEQAVGGIVLREVDGLCVIDNYIAGNGEGGIAACGIFVDGCQGLQVTGNTVIGNGSHKLQSINFNDEKSSSEIDNPLNSGPVKITVSPLNGAANIEEIGCEQNYFNLKGLNCRGTATIEFTPGVQLVYLTLSSTDPESLTIKAFDSGPERSFKIQSCLETLEIVGTEIKKIEISGNKNPHLVELSFGDRILGYQAGIVGLNVESSSFTRLELGRSAAKVHNNLIISPQGQALIINGWGPMSITGNKLTSQGRGELPFFEGEVLRAIFGASQALSIFNMGCTLSLLYDLTEEHEPVGTGIESSMPRLLNAKILGMIDKLPLDGQVIFDDNQITLKSRASPRFMLPKFQIPTEMGSMLISFDDLSIQNNQFLADAAGLLTNALALSFTLRLSGNRFVERSHRALVSCISIAAGNITTDNQAAHCIYSRGLSVKASDNQMLHCRPAAK